VSIVQGQNLVRRGEFVSESEFETLTKLGLVRGAGGLVTTLQMLLLGALIAWLFATYVNSCQPNIVENDRALAVIIGLFAITLLAGRLLIPNSDLIPYAFPLATISVLLTVLFSGELALVATFAIAPLLGLQHEQTMALALPLALGAAAGIYTAQRARRTTEFALVGLSVAAVTALGGLAFWVGPSARADDIAQIFLLSVINGALSGVLAVGSYHFLGRIAGVVTPLELMELSHPNQPLLRRLMREAPGTYHHSMVVGNLAEVAAENIGADPSLARVGAYYHDVGKLLRPYFFTDNQHDRSNVHDVLDAKTSASVIIDHVREGAKLAIENGLPQRVVDFIPQHHGTNLVSYFYQRALQENEDADIEAFRYPGPKPQTREAAIMMLADGVEATVRAKSQAGKLRSARNEQNGDGSGQTISEIVDQIVNERITAQQLDESPLTLRDLAVIKESFIQTLQGIYHPRVDYPQARVRPVEEPATP
jgi:putative nucleotidyltransferase with HDIG domain